MKTGLIPFPLTLQNPISSRDGIDLSWASMNHLYVDIFFLSLQVQPSKIGILLSAMGMVNTCC